MLIVEVFFKITSYCFFCFFFNLIIVKLRTCGCETAVFESSYQRQFFKICFFLLSLLFKSSALHFSKLIACLLKLLINAYFCLLLGECLGFEVKQNIWLSTVCVWVCVWLVSGRMLHLGSFISKSDIYCFMFYFIWVFLTILSITMATRA